MYLLNKKNIFYVGFVVVSLLALSASIPYLAANIGVSTAVAKKIIDIIDTYSTIATILSLVGIILGYGVLTTALVAAAKKIISKYGKAYAVTW